MMEQMKTSKHNRAAVRGLYVITPDENDTARLTAMIEAAISGGADVVQYRNKQAVADLRLTQSRAVLDVCRRYQVPLIINDDAELCLAIDADGVHIGANDGHLAEVRAKIGTSKILGASCYDDLALALKAQSLGADYVAFGACFSSATKPNAPVADLSLFKQGERVLSIPKVAIGGIALNNARQAIEAGADAIAVIGALFTSVDISNTAQQFSLMFKQTHHHDLTQSAII
jgi:thiamine-phosphate pyrophosphorylase